MATLVWRGWGKSLDTSQDRQAVDRHLSTQGESDINWARMSSYKRQDIYVKLYLLLTVPLGIILFNEQLDAQFFFVYVYFNSLHVSSIRVLIIRRFNCINTISGIRMSHYVGDRPVCKFGRNWAVCGSNPGGDEIFRTCPDRLWGPSSLLYDGYRAFPGGKQRPGRDADPSPPSSAVAMKG